MNENVLTDTQILANTIVAGLQEKKGIDILKMDLRKLGTAVANYFVICSASSDRQSTALAESVEKMVKEKHQERPFNTEGRQTGEWILLDYVDVVVHIFIRDKREFYNIEDLWGDAQIERYENVF